jgi:hypothetical protein
VFANDSDIERRCDCESVGKGCEARRGEQEGREEWGKMRGLKSDRKAEEDKTSHVLRDCDVGFSNREEEETTRTKWERVLTEYGRITGYDCLGFRLSITQ